MKIYTRGNYHFYSTTEFARAHLFYRKPGASQFNLDYFHITWRSKECLHPSHINIIHLENAAKNVHKHIFLHHPVLQNLTWIDRHRFIYPATSHFQPTFWYKFLIYPSHTILTSYYINRVHHCPTNVRINTLFQRGIRCLRGKAGKPCTLSNYRSKA